MRWLGVDLGARRVGLAVSEDDEGPAAILPTITIAPGGEAAAVIEAARTHRIDRVVIGLPLEMSGKEGLAAKRARAIGRVVEAAGVAVELIDERLTSRQAHRALSASGKRRKEHAGKVDAIAAKILLDTHLEMQRR